MQGRLWFCGLRKLCSDSSAGCASSAFLRMSLPAEPGRSCYSTRVIKTERRLRKLGLAYSEVSSHSGRGICNHASIHMISNWTRFAQQFESRRLLVVPFSSWLYLHCGVVVSASKRRSGYMSLSCSRAVPTMPRTGGAMTSQVMPVGGCTILGFCL